MRWLHISDLHIDSSYKSKRGENWFYFAIPPARGDFFGSFFRGLNARVYEKKEKEEKKVDFIVFTGDLFNHGRWNQGQKEAAVQFLEDVYRVCAEACGWKVWDAETSTWRLWKSGDQMERLFYCPGNHDVFRSAYHIEDDSYVTLRSNLLDSIVKGGTPVAPEDGYFCAETANNSVERQVLMDKTFSLFDNAMRNCGKYQSGNHGEFRYEFRQFILPKDIQLKSAVVGLNTALLAGRPYSQDDITEALMDTWDKFQRAHAKFDFEAAREAYNEYQDAYKKQLGLIKDDKEHLCFISHSAATALTNTLVFGGYQYPILFGHHPISFYSEEAERAFLNFADAVHAQVYLCGHTHKPEVNSIHHGARMNWQRILEITLGGIFVDKSGYNEASFAIEELEYNASSSPKLTVSIYTHIEDKDDVFGFDQWVERTQSIDLQTISNDVPPPSPKPASDIGSKNSNERALHMLEDWLSQGYETKLSGDDGSFKEDKQNPKK